MLNKAGKTFTIFGFLIIILLVALSSIGFFLYSQEAQLRKTDDMALATSRESEARLQIDLTETKKQLALLQDKNKAADLKINNLLDEMDLNEGLRNELKKENATLKEQVDGFSKAKDKMKTDFDGVQQKLKESQDLIKAQEDKAKQLQQHMDQLEEDKKNMQSKITELQGDLKPYDQRSPGDQVDSEVIPPGKSGKNKIELDKIVVSPQDGVKGHVLSVDKEAEFIVCNLGLKQGVKSGDTLSVYRGEEYLGDVSVTRVQEEMSAADMVPPFSSGTVRKNDTVVFKQ